MTHAPDAPSLPQKGAKPVGHRQTIVLVDDHEDTLNLLVLYLELHGFVVEGFTGSEAAMQRIVRGPEPCLLVVDYDIGEGDEFIRLARARGLTSPIVVITAVHPAYVDESALHQLGVAYVLAKPFGPDELAKLVEAEGRQGCR